MKDLVGIYYVLATLPIWATAGILFLITLATILVGRDVLEGLPYNVAYSSMIGDAGLIVSFLVAATILQRGEVHIPLWLQGGKSHNLILLASWAPCVIVCLITLGSRSGQLMDIYHDLVIAPLILYFAITLVPVIYYNGTSVEKWSVVCFVLLWLVLVVFDIKYDRMNQRRWLVEHCGTSFKNQTYEETDARIQFLRKERKINIRGY